MKKIMKVSLIAFLAFLLLIILLFIFNNYRSSNVRKDLFKSTEIPDDYICCFHGGAGEITYQTYIYKIDNGHANYGFKYINSTRVTKSWGSSEWNENITSSGTLNWTDNCFEAAYANNAYGYVTINGDNKIYSIDEFQDRFLMN